LFYCPNVGSTPKRVYASRVNDGICDCCDGSDEAGLQARRPNLPKCVNKCAEEGAKQQEERAAKMEALKVGLTKKEAAIKDGKVNQEKWKQEIADKEAKTAELQAALTKAEEEDKAQKAEEAAKKASETPAEGGSDDAALRKEIKELRDLVSLQSGQIAELMVAVQDLKAARKRRTPPEADAGAAAEPEEKKQVSEYAKWMENAGSTPGAIEGEQPKEAKQDEVPEEEDFEEAEQEDELDTKYNSGSPGTAVTKARIALDDHKGGIESLKKKLSSLSDDRLGYAMLTQDECLKLNDGQYEYKACFFGEASQDNVKLGTWSGWTGPKTAEFTNGDLCHGGPARKFVVVFQCGGESQILDVIEPSRCVYQARISTPGACEPEEAALLEKPPVKHPRDEL